MPGKKLGAGCKQINSVKSANIEEKLLTQDKLLSNKSKDVNKKYEEFSRFKSQSCFLTAKERQMIASERARSERLQKEIQNYIAKERIRIAQLKKETYPKNNKKVDSK